MTDVVEIPIPPSIVPPIISVQGVEKWYGTFQVLKGIDLEVYPQEVVVLMGPSGSGKSTLIRTLNGLETHEKGVLPSMAWR
jgi:ABC-type polar amino acid transport system ATPase subunit